VAVVAAAGMAVAVVVEGAAAAAVADLAVAAADDANTRDKNLPGRRVFDRKRAALFYAAEWSMSEQHIEVEGTISAVLPGTMFKVKLDNQHEVLAHISGKMRKHFVRLTAGDRVRLEMSPYDLTKARITFRLR
jgi:translation initiation factor IF-1